jgi:hypothetical protein
MQLAKTARNKFLTENIKIPTERKTRSDKGKSRGPITPQQAQEIIDSDSRVSMKLKIGGPPLSSDRERMFVRSAPKRDIKMPMDIGIFEDFIPNVTLLLSDIHFPYHHVDALKFIKAVVDHFDPDLTVILGDELDSHSLSFYPHHPDLANATRELEEGRKCIKELDAILGGDTMPVLAVESNHTSRVYRKGKSAGIPRGLILPYEDVLGVDWRFSKDWVVPIGEGEDLLCSHQKGNNARTAGQQAGMSIAMGHFHKRCQLDGWTDNLNRERFALQVPCLIDFDSPAYSYDENSPNRPNLGCAVVIKGIPTIVRMFVDKDNRWTGDLWRTSGNK